jgi:DNA-binding MarR family transcriptional regulator
MEAIEKVLKILKDEGEPLRSGDIADKSGLDKKEVDKAVKKLVAENKVHSPKRCFYAAT